MLAQNTMDIKSEMSKAEFIERQVTSLTDVNNNQELIKKISALNWENQNMI